jgi:hypothetical protein
MAILLGQASKLVLKVGLVCRDLSAKSVLNLGALHESIPCRFCQAARLRLTIGAYARSLLAIMIDAKYTPTQAAAISQPPPNIAGAPTN